MIKIDDFYTIENMDDTELINYRSWLTSHLNLNDGIQNVSVYGYGSNIGRSKSIEYNAKGNICRIRYYDGYTNTPLHENFPSQIEFFGDKLPGKHRKADIYWSTDDYIVLNCIMFPGNPPLYKVKNLKTGEIPNALYTNEQLQII